MTARIGNEKWLQEALSVLVQLDDAVTFGALQQAVDGLGMALAILDPVTRPRPDLGVEPDETTSGIEARG